MSTFSHESLTPKEKQAFARIVDALGFGPKIILGRGKNSHPLDRAMTAAENEDILYGIISNGRAPHEAGEVERFSLVAVRVPLDAASSETPPQREHRRPLTAPELVTRIVTALKEAGAAGLARTAMHHVCGNSIKATQLTRLLRLLETRGTIVPVASQDARERRWAYVGATKKATPPATKEEPAAMTRRRRKATSRSWAARQARWGKVGMSPEGAARRLAKYNQWVEKRRAQRQAAGNEAAIAKAATVMKAAKQALFE